MITLLSVMFSCIAMANAFADVPVDMDHFPSAEFRKMANGWDRDKEGIVEDSEVSDVTNLFIRQIQENNEDRDHKGEVSRSKRCLR